jgi:hypothetical protein
LIFNKVTFCLVSEGYSAFLKYQTPFISIISFNNESRTVQFQAIGYSYFSGVPCSIVATLKKTVAFLAKVTYFFVSLFSCQFRYSLFIYICSSKNKLDQIVFLFYIVEPDHLG